MQGPNCLLQSENEDDLKLFLSKKILTKKQVKLGERYNHYEYDEKMNLLILDKKWPSDYTFTELIKITHALSKKHIHFFIDVTRAD